MSQLSNSNETFGDLLRKQLYANISETNKELDSLRLHFKSLELALAKVKLSEVDSVLVHLGDEYFMEKNRKEAETFILSRLGSITQKVNKLENRVLGMEGTIEQIATGINPSELESGMNGINAEGLPFTEIIEELDEDGNIISAKVNMEEVHIEIKSPPISTNQGFKELNSNSLNETNISSPTEEETCTKNIVGNISSNELLSGKAVDNDADDAVDSDRLEDLMKEMQVCDHTKYGKSPEDGNEKLSRMIDKLEINDYHKSILKRTSGAVEDMSSRKVVNLNPNVNSNKSEFDYESTDVEGILNMGKDNILELELIADQFVEPDLPGIANDEEQDWDYDFEDTTGTDEEDDIADDILYGENSVFFSNDSRSENLLWEEISKLRVLSKSNSKEIATQKKKSVHFASELEIKEIENISDALKDFKYEDKTSLFKQRKSNEREYGISTGYDTTNNSVKQPWGSLEVAAETDRSKSQNSEIPFNKIDVNSTFDISAKAEVLNRKDLMEKSFQKNGKPSLKDSEKTTFEIRSDNMENNQLGKQKVSKFKMLKSRQQPDTFKNTVTDVADGVVQDRSKYSSAQVVEEFVTERGIYDEPIVTDGFVTQEESVDSSSSDLHKAASTIDVLDVSNSTILMNNMMKAYISGEYDDDIETRGPVVHKLDDFEELNEIVESKLLHDQKQKGYHIRSDNDTDLDDMDDEDDDDDNGENHEILRDQIVENAINYDFYNEFQEESLSENYLLSKEVTENYHKLRQKLIFDKRSDGFRKSAEEKEYEPIDEHGNSIKISRFKATRLQ